MLRGASSLRSGSSRSTGGRGVSPAPGVMLMLMLDACVETDQPRVMTRAYSRCQASAFSTQ